MTAAWMVPFKFQRAAEKLFVVSFLWVSFSPAPNYTIWTMNPNFAAVDKNLPTAIALRLTEKEDEQGFPSANSWNKASAIVFDHDWRGGNHAPSMATEVRLLWMPDTLFLRFVAKYQSLNVYSEARSDGWRDELWERDVTEVFFQPDSSDPLKYKEFEVGPNGYWIDLDISHGEREELHSGLRRRVVLDEHKKTWAAELAIPMKALTSAFDPKHDWRVNFYRVEGQTEPRFYSAWSPTHTDVPNFHVPSAFGKLSFR